MITTDGGTKHYLAALDAYAGALRDGRATAEVLIFFAGHLKGDPGDLDGPPMTVLPTPERVLGLLRQIDRARSDVEREWERLGAEARENAPSPDALAEEA